MAVIPAVLKETSGGMTRYEILDEMFQGREIECTGEITAELVNSLILQLRYLQKEAPKQEITMYINSPGGEVSSGLALYDVMKAVKCPIRTVCLGTVASMAALLFISGDTRDMFCHSRIMIHDPILTHGIEGSTLKIADISRDLMRTREITGRIIAEHTGRTLEEVYAKTAKDSYFCAEEAVNFGLADNIISEI